MKRNHLRLIFVALGVAALAIAPAQDRGKGKDEKNNPPPKKDEHSQGGYSRDQKGQPRDNGSKDKRPAPDYHGTHNNFQPSTPHVQIPVVTSHVVAREKDHKGEGKFRSGYYHKDPGWTDNNFRFHFYVFDYDSAATAFSPFYYYHSLPGYVALDQVNFQVGLVRFTFDRRVSWDDRANIDRDLENAISDMIDAVQRQDLRALSQIVPAGYWIDVYPGVGKPYSIGSDDFYDMIADMAKATTTTNYGVVSIETGNNCARVVFEHDHVDAWNRTHKSFHRVTLDYVGNGYRVAMFETKRTGF